MIALIVEKVEVEIATEDHCGILLALQQQQWQRGQPLGVNSAFCLQLDLLFALSGFGSSVHSLSPSS